MTHTSPPQVSFSSGEISPLLHARTDYSLAMAGVRAMSGFLPMREGGFTRAPGTIFRGYVRGNSPAVLVPFEFARNDALQLEFTDGFLRVWRYGALVDVSGSPGTPYELATPYVEADQPNLSWAQSFDVSYMASGNKPVQKFSRLALDSWIIGDADLQSGPFRVQNLNEAKTVQCSGETGYITLSGSGGVFQEDHVGSLMLIKPVDYTTVPFWTEGAAISVGDLRRYDGNIYELITGTNAGTLPPIHNSGTHLYDSVANTQWKYISDDQGIVKIISVINANSATATVFRQVPRPCVDDATYRWSEGAWSDIHGYPIAVEIHEQSLFAASTQQDPRTIWASTQGDFVDFIPSAEADGSLAYSVSGSDSQNAIKWLRRARRGIYIGTVSEVFRGFSSVPGQRIGPTTFDTDVEANDGASEARPISPYGYPIYINKSRGRVEELRYSFEEEGGSPVELSGPSEHLGAEGFAQIVWQSAPHKHAWVRRDNGDLVLMLYGPKEKVLGWAVVPMAGGFVESLAVTPSADGKLDVLTMVVRRTINGSTVRMVEEQALTFGSLAGDQPIHEANHLFATSVFDEVTPKNTFSVPHLIGETVYAWTDQGQFGPLVVPGSGDVQLESLVSHAVIGLFDDTHNTELLDVVAAAPEGDSRGRPKRLHAGGGLVLHKTAAGYVRGVERDIDQPARLGDRHDLFWNMAGAELISAFSGTTHTEANTGYAGQVSYRFEPSGGAPMTVLSVIPPVEESGI